MAYPLKAGHSSPPLSRTSPEAGAEPRKAWLAPPPAQQVELSADRNLCPTRIRLSAPHGIS
jgi:hypothetical protein